MSRPIYHDPFASETIVNLPPLLTDSGTTWEGFQFNASLEGSLLRLKPPDVDRLPKLQPEVFSLNVEDIPLQDLSAPSLDTTDDSDNEFYEVQEQPLEHGDARDIWALPEISERRIDRLITWDDFLGGRHEEPQSGYLSEVHPQVFGAIANWSDTRKPSRIVRSQVLLDALFELAMGRSSGLFEWDEETMEFRPRWNDIYAAGYSRTILQNSTTGLSSLGKETRKLLNLFTQLDSQGHKLLPSTIALLSSARWALFAAHKHLEDRRSFVTSVLQLNIAVDKVRTLVQFLARCCSTIDRFGSDHEVIPWFVQIASEASASNADLAPLLQAIFVEVTKPILETLSAAIGLSSTPVRGDFDGPVEIEETDAASWSALVSAEASRLVREARKGLKLLSADCMHRSAYKGPSNAGRCNTKLEPVFTHSAVSEQEILALQYEEAATLSIPSVPPHNEILVPEKPSQTQKEEHTMNDKPFHFDLDLFALDTPGVWRAQRDGLGSKARAYLDSSGSECNSGFRLHLDQVLTCSLKPMIAVQHRLVSFSILQLLFSKHCLLAHVGLQRKFHLLGSPAFSHRLTAALFDSNQSSSENKRHTGATTGLRLQARETWPPAGSELRLVLAGVLSESFVALEGVGFEESISFAIRDMTPEDLERCRNVDSIHTLDFLKLQYRAPTPLLESVFTTEILCLYDRLFLHLLRILRLRSVTERLLRGKCSKRSASRDEVADHKLIVQMHHFISTLADYCQNTVIEICWQKFEGVLKEVKSHIDKTDYEGTVRLIKGQDYLNILHEQALANVLHGMLLGHEQSTGLELLHELFNLILAFDAARRNENERPAAQGRHDTEFMTRRFDLEFKDRITRLIGFLQGQRQSLQAGFKPMDEDAETTIGDLLENLLLRLDLFGFWSSGGRRWTSHLDYRQ